MVHLARQALSIRQSCRVTQLPTDSDGGAPHRTGVQRSHNFKKNISQEYAVEA